LDKIIFMEIITIKIQEVKHERLRFQEN